MFQFQETDRWFMPSTNGAPTQDFAPQRQAMLLLDGIARPRIPIAVSVRDSCDSGLAGILTSRGLSEPRVINPGRGSPQGSGLCLAALITAFTWRGIAVVALSPE